MLFRCCSTYTAQALFSGHLCAEDMVLVYATIWLQSIAFGNNKQLWSAIKVPLFDIPTDRSRIARGCTCRQKCARIVEQSDGVYFSHLRIGVSGYWRQHRKASSDGAFLLMFIHIHHASHIQWSSVCSGFDVDSHNNLVFRLQAIAFGSSKQAWFAFKLPLLDVNTDSFHIARDCLCMYIVRVRIRSGAG